MPEPDAERAFTVPGLPRRAVVAGAGFAVLGVSLVAAGCASGSTPARAPAAPPGTVLGPVADVPVGGGMIYPAARVVVTQPTAGSYQGFSAVCTHQGCLVNQVARGTINCPCHGSRYHLDGTVADGPAPRPLPSMPVTVSGGQLTVA